MHDLNEIERAVADELRRDAGPLLPVDDRAVYESVSTHGRPRWNASLLRFTTYLAAGLIVALFGGFLIVGVATQPSGDGIPVAPGGSAPPEGTPSVGPTQAPTPSETQENDVNLKTPLATALAVAALASPAVPATAQTDLMEPARVTGTTTFPEQQASGSRAWIDNATRLRDQVMTHQWEASDPRLDGLHTTTFNSDVYDRQDMSVAVGFVTHENDEGSWVGEGTYMGGLDLGGTTTMIMYGQDAYEGLTAYVVVDEESGPISFSAVIFPGDMPEMPIE